MSSSLTEKAGKRRLPGRNPIAAILVGVMGLFGLDALLFRTPLYPSILEPDSSAGLFEMTLRRERQAQLEHGDNLVVTLGDSRFAYSTKIADTVTPETGLIFRHAGVAGSDARSWYYMLRDLDPKANRYRAVILGTPDYDDEDEAFNPFDDIRALHYVVARLRWTDSVRFALSFQNPEFRWQAFRGALLKGTVLQQDILAFLKNPIHRLDYVALCRRGWAGWTYDYQETTRSMAGLKIDWTTRTATYPPDSDQNQHDTLERVLDQPAPQTGRLAAYRREWFGRIVERYRGSRTRIIFVRLPRGPIPPPEGFARKLSSSIREFASAPNVMLTDEHAFEPLERPELFKDGIHLNRAGIGAFTPMLAREISRMIGR
jgi:hypothetical protein